VVTRFSLKEARLIQQDLKDSRAVSTVICTVELSCSYISTWSFNRATGLIVFFIHLTKETNKSSFMVILHVCVYVRLCRNLFENHL